MQSVSGSTLFLSQIDLQGVILFLISFGWCGGQRDVEELHLLQMEEYSVTLKRGFVPYASPSQNRSA